MGIGAHNAITDVDGIRVGHANRAEPGWLTGVTVIVPPEGTVAGVDVRGGGPGTRETDLLDPRNSVDRVDAVVLTGGSAFGLATADGVVRSLYAAGQGWPVGPEPGQVVPIVPTAVLFDLGRAGEFDHTPTAELGADAYAAAASGPVEQGNVGAGTGAVTGGLKGGIGTASLVLPSGHTVGAIVAVNAVGSAIALDGRLLGAGLGIEDEFAELPSVDPERLAAHWQEQADRLAEVRAGMATTIAIVATDATLDKAGCQKLAGVAHDGMARALSPVHTAFDGDTIFTLATGARPVPDPIDLMMLQTAAADCLTRAIVHAMVQASTVDRTSDGGVAATAWSDLTTPAQREE